MPYKDKAQKAANQKAHRAKNRAAYVEAERVRREKMTPEQRAESAEKKRQYAQYRSAAGLVDLKRRNESAKRSYHRKKHDPVFRQKAVQRMREWTEKNRDRFNETIRRIRARRMANDLSYRIARGLRSRFYMAVKNRVRSGNAIRELGCSIEEFRAYIETKFAPGMSWDNWSPKGWHLDHIIPLSTFDLTDPEQVKRACHYTNFQPLWAKLNVSKGAKIIKDWPRFYAQAWGMV